MSFIYDSKLLFSSELVHWKCYQYESRYLDRSYFSIVHGLTGLDVI